MSRVTEASVTVDGTVVGRIGPGLLVLLGATHGDTDAVARAFARKVAGLRILRGGERDDVCALDSHAPVLVVSQFTLYGDTARGRRPSWGNAAPGEHAEPLVAAFGDELSGLGLPVETGVFGAMMAVHSINDGPVTLIMESA